MSNEQVLKLLHEEYPNVHYYLNFSTPLELVMAAILSPQVRDEVVNNVTPTLFKKYTSAKSYAQADYDELLAIIKPITFSSAKAKHLIESGKVLVEKFKGEVPKTVEELTLLPGVGEKTAHAILQNAFNITQGVVVDTHVLRIAFRLGLSTHEKNASIVKKELEKVIPKLEWKELPWLFKAHGRKICTPKPKCEMCVLEKLCPKRGVA